MFRSSSDCATGRCRKASSIRFTRIPEGHPGLRAPGRKRGRRRRPATLSARLGGHVTLEARPDGDIAACFDGYSVGLGTFSAAAADRAQDLRTVCRSARSQPGGPNIDKEIRSRWSGGWPRHGLLEYRLGLARTARTRSSSNRRSPIIGRECRSSAMPTFSCCRGSPICGGAATRWSWNRRAPARCSESAIRRLRPRIAMLSAPQPIKRCAGRTVFRDSSFSPCWWIARSFSRSIAARDSGLRPSEGDDDLVLWDFHDLLFHARSTEGRHANPLGGIYPYAGVMPPLPAVRPRWPGQEDRSEQILGRGFAGRFAGRKAPA